MGLNIKNADVERLAAEVAALAGETKTQAIRVALEARRAQLAGRAATTGREARLRAFLEQRVWVNVPPHVSRRRLTKREEEAILGYGPEGA